MRLRFTPFLSSLLPLPGLLLYSNLLLLAPGVSSRLARPWRLALSRSPSVSLLILSCLAPGVVSRLALSSFTRPRRLISSCSLPASCLVSLATSILSRLACPRRLVLSRSLPVWSRSPPASRLVWSRSAPASSKKRSVTYPRES